jgi:hypothetical protein
MQRPCSHYAAVRSYGQSTFCCDLTPASSSCCCCCCCCGFTNKTPCSYWHYDTLKVLLEAGGKPLLLDCQWHSRDGPPQTNIGQFKPP